MRALTGRAGRSGEAILFIAPRERGMLRAIERATRQPITPMELPTVADVNDVRKSKFKQQITDTLAGGELTEFRKLIEDYEREMNVPAIEIATALAKNAGLRAVHYPGLANHSGHAIAARQQKSIVATRTHQRSHPVTAPHHTPRG